MQSQDKKISINALYLYLRMFFSLLVGLYTSRVILANLGVDDFGVYNIVGGIVSMMTFLNSSMSGATSRFLAYYLGMREQEKIARCFTSAFQIHLCIGLLLLLSGETVGLWFVNTQLVIDPAKMVAANYVYQFSLLSAFITICKVPYTANVISNEKMNHYALLEILYVFLKLGVALLIPLFAEKLIFYAFLLLVSDIVIFSCYCLYSHRNYAYCKIQRGFDREMVVSMMSFSVLDLFGNGTFTARQIGTNVLINRSFGVALNAASGIATQVGGVVSSFVSSAQNAFSPQIIKSYAVSDYALLQHLMRMECKISILLASVFFTPLFLNIDFIMQLWLKTVPAYAQVFCQFILISNFFSVINNILMTVIHATGKIKGLSYTSGLLNLLCLLGVYVFFRLGFDAEYAYVALALCVGLQTVTNIIIVKRLVSAIRILHFVVICLKMIFIALCSLALTLLLTHMMESPWLVLSSSVVLNTLFLTLLVYASDRSLRKIVKARVGKIANLFFK